MIENKVRLFLFIIILAVSLFIYFRVKKYLSSSESSESLFAFLPFIYSLMTFPTIALLYCSLEITPYYINLQKIFSALEKHTFLSFWLKCFIASSAIIIAWHRSIVNDIQIKMQTDVNRLTNFYDTKKHFFELLPAPTKDTYEIIPTIEKSNHNKFYFNFFKNPQESDYSLSDNFKKCFSNILSTVEFTYSRIDGDISNESIEYTRAIDTFNYELKKIGIDATRTLYQNDEPFSLSLVDRFMILKVLEGTLNSLPINNKFKTEFKDFKDFIDNKLEYLIANSGLIEGRGPKSEHGLDFLSVKL
jgi:hypothetical protein